MATFLLLNETTRNDPHYYIHTYTDVHLLTLGAHAERVTVVVSCVYLSVCLSVCMYVCPNTLFWQYAQL